jgi:ribosomal protein S17E
MSKKLRNKEPTYIAKIRARKKHEKEKMFKISRRGSVRIPLQDFE